jgi:alkanesulfonate monooxygenase SsuD/methylene tetrahydromethanopterin reductase-like flavin-dependent oxidoreductase (luciferase family)
MTFRPTVAPPGRLVRLGVVLDTRNRPERLREIARMCEGAWISSVWARDDFGDDAGDHTDPRLEAWTAATLASTVAPDPTIGVHVQPSLRSAEMLGAMAATLDAASGGRLELCFARPQRPEGAPDLGRYVGAVRERLMRDTAAVGGTEAGLIRLSVEANDEEGCRVAADLADDAVLSAWEIDDVTSAIDRVYAACDPSGRDHATLGIAFLSPVSIGRTTAEARARAASEPLFATLGSPADGGVFGTLEQCQERVIELAHAGVTDLRCIIPNNPDVHDVIAQLSAVGHGSTELLTPDAPRSRAPDPPESWGGRPRVR